MSSIMTKPLDSYRSDIDGIRAIAVLSVIVFHVNKSILPGGFVGVDIFFVISGYLISLHILRDLDSDRFSILEFYRRRVKRIVPAMLVVVASVIIVSLIMQRPQDTREVARTSVAALLSLSNVYFWLFKDSSYFAQASNEIPLLHLWSLGVEEQFYIFWPLILMVFYRVLPGKYFVALLFIFAAMSFALGQFLYPKSQSFVYFMLPARAGELLIGALVAYGVTKKPDIVIPRLVVVLTAIIGISFIVISLFYLSEDVIFPGLFAIPPTLGTSLLLFSGHYGNSWIKQLLMLRPLVYIGLVSYSAYLWHWPLLSFAHYSLIEINLLSGVAIIILTIVFSILSYSFIERPARWCGGTARMVITCQYLIPASVILVFSVLLYKSDGFFMHNNSEKYKVSTGLAQPAYAYHYVCQRYEITVNEIDNANCVVGAKANDKNMKPYTLLWGDSNAAHYIGIVGTFAQEAKFSFRNLEHASCPPLFSDPKDFVSPERVDGCRKSLHRMTQVLDDYEVIIISSAWTSYDSRSEKFLPNFFKTVEVLRAKGKLVILLGQIPPIKGYDRTCKEKSIGIPWVKCSSREKSKLDESVVAINAKLRDFASLLDGVEYFDVIGYMCSNGLCYAYDKNGELLYYDSGHLSMSASWKVGKGIVEKMSGVPYPFTLISKHSNSEN